jgi:glycosyltransferase involved in cell wall biosynthesis
MLNLLHLQENKINLENNTAQRIKSIMKIIFFINTNVAVGGGIERALINYVNSEYRDNVTVVQSQFFQVKRIDPDILSRMGLKQILTIRDFEHCISFLKLHRATIPLYQMLLPFMIRYTKFVNRKLLRQIQGYDVVYLFKNEYWPLFTAKKVIGSNHGQFAFNNFYTRVLVAFIRSGLVYRKIDAFHLFPKSAEIGRRMNKPYFIGKIGTDTTSFYPRIRSNKINILYVARLIYIKGVDIFLDTAERMSDDDRFVFNIAGSGDYSSIIEARKLGNVRYHGVLSDDELAELFGKCDIFVYPTRWDALPTVIVEAVSSGEYVITSRILRGSYDDLEQLGFLEYTDPDPEKISERLISLSGNIDKLRSMSSREHEYAEKTYDNSVVTKKLYSDILSLTNSQVLNQS